MNQPQMNQGNLQQQQMLHQMPHGAMANQTKQMQQQPLMQPSSHEHQMQNQQTPQQPNQQQQQQQQQIDQKQDNISKVKHLYGQLYECLMETLRAAGFNINNNANIDQGLKRVGETNNMKFEETLEKFYSVYDQMELHLKTAIDYSVHTAASQRHSPSSLSPNAADNQKYAHFTSAVKNQVNYVKELHNELVNAASNVSNIASTRTSGDHMTSMDTSS